jgi:hypothetical protein
VPAVLDREVVLTAKVMCPPQEPIVPGAVAGHGLLSKRSASHGIEGNCGVGLHVRVDADYDHL